MTPLSIIARLALVLILYAVGLATLAYQFIAHRDLALGLVWLMICCTAAWAVGPPEDAVHDLIDQLRKIEN